MCSRFDDSSICHDVDLVGEAGGGETMRDHDHGPALSQRAKAAEPIGFRPRIHRAGRLVEDEDRRLPKKCPRQGDPIRHRAGSLGRIEVCHKVLHVERLDPGRKGGSGHLGSRLSMNHD